MNTSMRSGFRGPGVQQGAALAVGLIFLVLVTLVAVVAMRQSIVQERMAGGLRNIALARNGAESVLRNRESFIFNWYLTSNGRALVGSSDSSQRIWRQKDRWGEDFRRGTGFYQGPYGAPLPTTNHDFTNAGANGTGQLARQPLMLVEDLGRMRPPGVGIEGEGGATGKEGYEGSGAGSPAGNSDIRVYRILGRSTGGLETIVRTTESTYAGRGKG